jgi:hypothetical protein
MNTIGGASRSASSFCSFEPVDIRQLEIEYEAGRRVRFVCLEKLGRRGEHEHVESGRGQEAGQRITYTCVVVDYEHDRTIGCHGCGTTCMGSVTVKVVPKPALRSADSWPS